MPELGRAISPLPARSRRQSEASRIESGSGLSLGCVDRRVHAELDTIGDGLQVRGAVRSPDADAMSDADTSTDREAWHSSVAFAAAAVQARTPLNATHAMPLRQPAEIVPISPRAVPTPAASEPARVATPAPPGTPDLQRRGLGGRGLAFLRGPRLKRAIDIAGSLALIGALTPVLGACAAAVRLSSPGPILFRQKRIGRNGEPFEMLKFRTMHQNADQTAHQQYVAKLIAGTADAHDADGAAVFKIVGDQRITPAGHWLRRLSLDELPQLINVLRGDMSLVGPRPPLPYEVEHYTPRHLQRLKITPGITGLWQVSGRSRTTFEEMIDLDLTYIERWSVSLDLQILLRTIPVVVFPDGL